jgi:hypothetical protein
MNDELIACDDCGCLNHQAMALREQLELAERDLRYARVEIAKLKDERAQSPKASPHYSDAMEVLGYWKQLCAPRTKELNGKRLEKAIARFNGGYDMAQLKLAVFGYSRRPYVTVGGRSSKGLPVQRHVDAELIFRDAKHVDAGIEMAEDELAGGVVAFGQPRGPVPPTPVERMQLRLGL